MYTSGILKNGEYDASRKIGSGLVGETAVNGSGMMNFGSHSSGNLPLRSYGFVAGNLTLRDYVKYGGKV
jgi:hypothetical protein